MKFSLAERCAETIVQGCGGLIRQVGLVVGLLVAASHAEKPGKLHYRKLEKAKNKALQYAQGNFDAWMTMNEEMKTELRC